MYKMVRFCTFLPSVFSQSFLFSELSSLRSSIKKGGLISTRLRNHFFFRHPVYSSELGFSEIYRRERDGSTLREIASKGPLNKSLCKKIICETCDALDYIHHKQIIHRDLKPENIIITNNGQILDARSDIYSLGVIISEVAGKWYSHIAARCLLPVSAIDFFSYALLIFAPRAFKRVSMSS